MTDIAVGHGTRVTLHFSIAFTDGTVVDSNFEGEPATFEVGDGNMLPAFEEALFGMRPGERGEFEILPEQGFGQHNPSNVQQISRGDFDPGIELEPGLVLSFADASQTELPGVVVDFDDETVTVDFNHPLAGRNLIFSVAIEAVEPITTH